MQDGNQSRKRNRADSAVTPVSELNRIYYDLHKKIHVFTSRWLPVASGDNFIEKITLLRDFQPDIFEMQAFVEAAKSPSEVSEEIRHMLRSVMLWLNSYRDELLHLSNSPLIRETLKAAPDLLEWFEKYVHENKKAKLDKDTSPHVLAAAKRVFKIEVIDKLDDMAETFMACEAQMEKFDRCWNSNASAAEKIEKFCDYCFILIKIRGVIETLKNCLTVSMGYKEKLNDKDSVKFVDSIIFKFEQRIAMLSDEVAGIKKETKKLIDLYIPLSEDMPPKYRAFIKPWLNKDPDPVLASTVALGESEEASPLRGTKYIKANNPLRETQVCAAHPGFHPL